MLARMSRASAAKSQTGLARTSTLILRTSSRRETLSNSFERACELTQDTQACKPSKILHGVVASTAFTNVFLC